MMMTYEDLKGAIVDLTFGPNEYGIEARHVLLIARDRERWLLTKHRQRGIEFPGGKVEHGETVEDAVRREAYEETGVKIGSLSYIGEYVVHTERPFCKAVYTGEIVQIDETYPLYETEGAIWLTEEQLKKCSRLSFHMKDRGMEQLIEWVKRYAK